MNLLTHSERQSQMRGLLHKSILVMLALLLTGCTAMDGSKSDDTQRIVVVSAFEGELEVLLPEVENPKAHVINGKTFTTGTLRGKPVVLFLSGISIINASVSVQMALDNFNVSHIVFSGIAGGVNPSFHLGDVVVPSQWANYQKQTFARDEGEWALLDWQTDKFGNFGMMFPQFIAVTRKGGEPDNEEKKFWFDVDPKMLAAANRAVKGVQLSQCDDKGRCLSKEPAVYIGGRGVSGPTFVNNRRYREWIWSNFKDDSGNGVNALDMESSAVAAVAYINGVPFIAFRSIADLAGGGEQINEIDIFTEVAAINAAKVTMKFLEAF